MDLYWGVAAQLDRTADELRRHTIGLDDLASAVAAQDKKLKEIFDVLWVVSESVN